MTTGVALVVGVGVVGGGGEMVEGMMKGDEKTKIHKCESESGKRREKSLLYMNLT